MAVVAEHKLTKEEFHARYDGEKPYFEYWNGEAVQKPVATLLHVLIQKILMALLDGIGYRSFSELEIRLHPDYEPVPDVVAMEKLPKGSYPTEPVEVVIEVLSPGDSFSRLLRKCAMYERWGIQQIVVIDPDARLVWRYQKGRPEEADVIATRGDKNVTSAALWEEVDRNLE